jgi:hypothetical protein
MPPRTIDNLGVDVSTRYAEDQKILDKTLIKEARTIPAQAEIEVTIPFFPSELEALLRSTPLQSSWASFIPPAMYFEQRKRLFTFQSIPSLGSEDKKESQTQKILAKLQLLEEKQEEKDQKKKREQQHSLEEEEREKKILTVLLQTIANLDKLIIDINSRRSQYQKG